LDVSIRIAFTDVIRFILQKWNRNFKVIVSYLKSVIDDKLTKKKYSG